MPPARTARALPGGGDRSRVGGEQSHIEAADVDPKFQRVSRNHAAQMAVPQIALNSAALEGQVATAVAAHRFRTARRLREIFFEVGDQDFGGQAAVGENNGLQLARKERLRQPACLVQVRPADAQLGVDDGGIIKDKILLPGGRSVVVHQRDIFFQDARGEFLRIGNRGGRADELRSAPVELCHALEPAQDVGEVTAQDPAIVM